jgi:hypothetical protein
VAGLGFGRAAAREGKDRCGRERETEMARALDAGLRLIGWRPNQRIDPAKLILPCISLINEARDSVNVSLDR